MGWRGGYGGWTGPWPGRGPFSYLPPWYRPGWWFGRGRGRGMCWWFFNPYIWGGYGYPAYNPYIGYGAYPSFTMPYGSRMRPYYSW